MRRALLLLSAAAITVSPLAAQPYYAQPYPQAYPPAYPPAYPQGYPQQGPASQGRYLNQRDVAEAQQEHAEVVRDLGGEVDGPRAAYVNSVGQKVAAFSGVANPGQAIHFTTLNSAVENAFSVPGGFV